MQNQQQSDRLSWGDTVFLHLEREGMPLNVASVCVFEGEIPFERLRRGLSNRSFRCFPAISSASCPRPSVSACPVGNTTRL